MTPAAPTAPVLTKPVALTPPPTPPAVLAAQASATPVAKTQTAQAAAAVAKMDAGREGQNSTKSGQALDTQANAFHLVGNRAAAGRGRLVDVSI